MFVICKLFFLWSINENVFEAFLTSLEEIHFIDLHYCSQILIESCGQTYQTCTSVMGPVARSQQQHNNNIRMLMVSWKDRVILLTVRFWENTQHYGEWHEKLVFPSEQEVSWLLKKSIAICYPNSLLIFLEDDWEVTKTYFYDWFSQRQVCLWYNHKQWTVSRSICHFLLVTTARNVHVDFQKRNVI